MKKARKLMALFLAACLTGCLLVGCSSSSDSSNDEETEAAEEATEAAEAEEEENEEEEEAAGSSTDYPNTTINGIVQWGEGGGTDNLMRPLSTLAQDILGQSIVVQNMTGGTGSIATQYVYDQDADGYNLLMGAENPELYDVLDIADLTYEDFDCVFLVGDETLGIIVSKDSPYNSLTELVEAAESGEEITMATTGTGGSAWVVAAFLKSATGVDFTQVQYDSDATAKTAVMSGECDFTSCKVQSGIEEYISGDVKYLCMLSTETVDVMSDVPLIVDEYPDFEQFLPWGTFYGVFVKKGTDSAIEETLSNAFSQAFEDESYQEVLENYYINAMGYTGDDADEYLSNWRTNVVDSLTAAGAIE